jgi:hypothetical protein
MDSDDELSTLRGLLQSDVNKNAADLMPTSASVLVVLILIGTFMYSLQNGFIYMIIGLISGFFITAFSATYAWNQIFHNQGYAQVPMIAHLAGGSLFVFILTGIFVYIELGFPTLFTGMTSLSVALLYQFGMLQIALYNWNRDDLEFGPHPKEDSEMTYAFKEELYIDLIEEQALKAQDDA